MRSSSILFICIILLSFLLRFYNLERTPPSLYWDEASLGYNAYAIAKAGIDEHGEYYPIARFIAFGDYKPPGYIYVAAFFIKFLGLSEIVVRLPSVLAGVGLVVLAYLLGQRLFYSRQISLLNALAISLSPWSIQLSRAAFEANLASIFNAAGVYFFLLAVRRHFSFLFLSMIFFVASFYTFNANRIIAPIIFFIFSIIFIKVLWMHKKKFFFSFLLGSLLIAPSIPYLRSPESRLRFQEVSIFTDLSIIEQANERIAREGRAWWARIIHNRRILFARLYLKHFVDHFNPRYLFLSGDVNPRLSTQAVGELYLYELPLLLAGIYGLVRKKKFSLLIITIWAVVAIVPAATARETPHALRTASLMPSYHLIIGYGGYVFWRWIKKDKGKRIKKRIKKIALIVAFLAVVGSWFYYLHYYHIHYPKDWAGEWQDGYKEMVETVSWLKSNYDAVVVTEKWGRPYIYFLLYNRVDPRFFVTSRRAKRDVFGFWDVYSFDKYYFGSEFNDQLAGKILFIGGPREITRRDRLLKKVYSRSGEVAFVIAER